MRRFGSSVLPIVAAARSWTRLFSGFSDSNSDDGFDLQSELAQVLQEASSSTESAPGSSASPTSASPDTSSSGPLVQLTKLSRPPAKFDLMTNSFAYEWKTTARHARKVVGPMREWASEIKYRTGVHVEMDLTHPELLESGGYAAADDVELTVYVFGTDKGVQHSVPLMESAVQQDPAYVRLGVFRRPALDAPQKEVEWLTLRRINRDNRPPDIPKISLKLPGKYTLFHENYKEAAIRTLFEETGISIADPLQVFPSGFRLSTDPKYFWRVPVRYFVAEVPHDVRILGPQTNPQQYMQGWDPRILRQSPDPIDREWARLADPVTGCAWMTSSMIDELQRPLRGDDYMSTRYTPPPHSDLQDVIKLKSTAV